MTPPPFFEIDFNTSAALSSPPQLDTLISESKRTGATDLLLLAHGFRCDTADATALYTDLLATLRPNLAAMTKRDFIVAGVYWPSKEFRETYGSAAALDTRASQDKFVASVLSRFGDGSDDPTEGLPLLHEVSGSELLSRLRTVGPPTRGNEGDCTTSNDGGVLTIPLADPMLNGVDTFLNVMSWTAMKKLSGEVGATGLAPSILRCRHELPAVRIHLAGHSLGSRLMAACCKTLGEQHAAPIDSLSLLEGAFSHFGFSPDAGWGQPGFFRGVIDSRIVHGPIISTFSQQDSVVGTAYAVASRLAHDRLQAIGDSADPYGGIGHNGAQRTPESIAIRLHRQGQPYQLPFGIVTCLDGSAIPGSAGLITGHGDVTNPHVTYAVASALCGAV